SFHELLDKENAPGPAWDGFRQLRVTDVVAEATDVFSIKLAAPDGGELPEAVRSYSLSTSPGYRVSVKQEPHGIGSAYMAQLSSGSLLEVAAARGEFLLDDGTGP